MFPFSKQIFLNRFLHRKRFRPSRETKDFFYITTSLAAIQTMIELYLRSKIKSTNLNDDNQ